MIALVTWMDLTYRLLVRKYRRVGLTILHIVINSVKSIEVFKNFKKITKIFIGVDLYGCFLTVKWVL